MVPIIIDFTPTNLGRIEIEADVMTGDRKSLKKVSFTYDSGSDFTTLSCDDLEVLGYTEQYLKSRPFHVAGASLAMGGKSKPLQYIENVSIKFGDRELQQCRVYFALETDLSSFFGSDILKYFNRLIDYDKGEMTLFERRSEPGLSVGENNPINIYSLEKV